VSIALLVITDGRLDYLKRTVASVTAALHGPVSERWMFDDTGDERHRSDLRVMFPTFIHINGGPRRGFGGAIQHAWTHLLERSEAGYVFHCEQDFTFNREIHLSEMVAVLDQNPQLAQLCLRRQPWNDEERAAGGIVESHPGDYAEMVDHAHRHWLEHRRFFSTNPSLYRRSLMEQGWPNVEHSEGIFTHHLLSDPDIRFGFWGSRDSGEWVTHIGNERVGVGY
jgi:hypothetical protein